MGEQKRFIGITDTTLRDSHQSLLATRMKTEDMLPIAEKMDNIGFHSLEVWGGATFDSCMRFLNEDPWMRLKSLRKAFKKTKLQMLLRGQNLLGYKHYADDVVEAFVEKSAEYGMDIFRVFDALNDVRNMQKAMEEVKKNKKHAQGTISYTTGSIYDIDYYVKLGHQLKDCGADSICIKDMAGLLMPQRAYDLIKALKEEVKLPIQVHTHYTSGMGSMMYLKAVEAGADVIDTANSSLALGTSQPATETMVAVLNDGPYETGIKLGELTPLADYFKKVRKKYAKYDVYKAGVDVNVLRYQVPGGMLSNFINQLKEQNALQKLDEVLAEVPRVREDFGYPPLVTPSSQIVGSQSVLNILLGERYKMCTNEVKNYMRGLYGNPPGKVNEEIRKKIIGDEKPITCRPADLIKPEMEVARREYPDADTTEKLLMYVLFPEVSKKFFANEEKEIKKEKVIQKDNTFLGKNFAKNMKSNKISTGLFNDGNPHKLNVTFEGKSFEIEVEEITSTTPLQEDKKPEKETDASNEKVVKAPMPGKIVKILKAPGDIVKKGEQIIILEAMKMENDILAPCDGKINTIISGEGRPVNTDEILFTMS